MPLKKSAKFFAPKTLTVMEYALEKAWRKNRVGSRRVVFPRHGFERFVRAAQPAQLLHCETAIRFRTLNES
jgi:hypothetical protein